MSVNSGVNGISVSRANSTRTFTSVSESVSAAWVVTGSSVVVSSVMVVMAAVVISGSVDPLPSWDNAKAENNLN